MSNTPNTDSTLRKDRQNWAEVINAVNSILNIIDKEVPLSVEVRQKVNDDVDTVLLRLIALKVQETRIDELEQIEAKVMDLYTPEITDLEKDEYQGINQPVIYLADVRTIIGGKHA